jgi:hypothetical protein
MLNTALIAAAVAVAAPALAQPITPPANVTPAKPVFAQGSMNIFRRFSPDIREKMVEFYNQVLGLQALTPIQLSKSQQMLLFRVGTGHLDRATAHRDLLLSVLSSGYLTISRKAASPEFSAERGSPGAASPR